MIRPLIGASLAALASLIGTARAQDEAWQTFTFTDENGDPVAGLIFGIPETDAALLAAYCHPATPGAIDVALYMGTGTEKPGDDATITFAIPGNVQARTAFVDGSFESETGPFFSMPLDRSDALWEALMSGSTSTVSANAGPAIAMHLRGSRAAIGSFLESCDALASAPSHQGESDEGMGPEGYGAGFGAWTASCSPCASYEDPMCTIFAGQMPQTIALVADDANPNRIGDIRIGMDLPGDMTGTLTVTVDGVPAATIPPDAVVYMGMTGEFLIQAPYLKRLLGAMSQGATVEVSFTSTSGETQSFGVPLDGFTEATAGLLANSPSFPRDAECRQ